MAVKFARKSARHSPLKKALAVLVYLCEHRFGASLDELCAQARTKRRNVHRYILALNEAGVRIRNTSGRGPGVRGNWRVEDRRGWATRIGLEQ